MSVSMSDIENLSYSPDSKDVDRIENMLKRANYIRNKIEKFAVNMAKSIKDRPKAARRAKACLVVYKRYSSSDIQVALRESARTFYKRYLDLDTGREPEVARDSSHGRVNISKSYQSKRKIVYMGEGYIVSSVNRAVKSLKK